MSSLEIYMRAYPFPDEMAMVARAAEIEGWDGLLVVDSQNLMYDPFVSLGLAARATSHIRLGTAVTNLVTRHPAVVAAAFATLQHVSEGRAILGVGRGDTAVELIARHPPSPGRFEALLCELQTYLNGRVVNVDGFECRIAWLPESGLPKVPVSVFASGPRMIAAGARRAERVTLAVGAQPERLRWAVELARSARGAAGLSPETLSLGAFVVTAAGADVQALRDLVRGNVSVSAHFQRGSLRSLEPPDREIVANVTREYDQYDHGLRRSPQARSIPDDFVDRFAAVGSAERCIEKLRALVDVGLDHLVLVGPTREIDEPLRRRWAEDLARHVLPAVRAG